MSDIRQVGPSVHAPGGLLVSVHRDGGRVNLILDKPGTPDGMMATLTAGEAAYLAGLLAGAAGVGPAGWPVVRRGTSASGGAS